MLGVDEDSDTVAGSGVENSPHVAVQSSELLKVLRSDTVRDVGERDGPGRSEERELVLGRGLEKEVEVSVSKLRDPGQVERRTPG